MMTVKPVKSAGQAKSYFGKEGDLEKTLGGYYTSDNAFGGGKWMTKRQTRSHKSKVRFSDL